MATTKDDIRGWIERGKKQGATHLLVVCDTYDWEDYPVFVPKSEDVKTVYAKFHGPNMQKVMEVYNLAKDTEAQLGEGRAHNF